MAIGHSRELEAVLPTVDAHVRGWSMDDTCFAIGFPLCWAAAGAVLGRLALLFQASFIVVAVGFWAMVLESADALLHPEIWPNSEPTLVPCTKDFIFILAVGLVLQKLFRRASADMPSRK